MTGRGQVLVLWDPEVEPPPGPLLDAAALANADWDWAFLGPEPAVRPPTMVEQRGTTAGVDEQVAAADVVVGVPTMWTLDHVARADVRFVAVRSATTLRVVDAEADGASVDGWPAPETWPQAIDEAEMLEDGHVQLIRSATRSAEDVADDMRQLLDEIQARHLPAAFRSEAPQHDGSTVT